MGKPYFLKSDFFPEIHFFGLDLRRCDTCEFGLLNNNNKDRSIFFWFTVYFFLLIFNDHKKLEFEAHLLLICNISITRI